MLDQISKLLTGEMLKVLSDMGHGDTIVFADANFPVSPVQKNLIRCPGMNISDLLDATSAIFPIDVDYTEHPAVVMELTPGDKARNLPRPEAWDEYEQILHRRYPELNLSNVERMDFYEKTKSAYAVFLTGESRIYGNLLLTKGIVR